MKTLKMKQLSRILGIFALALLLAGCGSSKKTLQRGEYYAAAQEAIKRLRESPDNKKQQEVLLQAYPLMKENSLRKISNAMELNVADKHIIAADEYLALNSIADAIYTCPKALQLIPRPEQYSRELSELLPQAAEEAYSLGERQLKLNTLQSAREAYLLFVKTNEYVSGYRDVNQKIAISLEMATFKVIVQKPITPQNHQITSDFFYNNIMSQISQAMAGGFVRFYTEEEARNERLTKPDQYLVLDFVDFAVGIMRETKNSADISRDSVLVGTTSVNGRNQDVYGKVTANFTTFRREVIAQGTLSAKIVQAANGRVEQNRNFPGKFTWFNEWATYKGDERALTDKQKKMASAEPVMPPPPQDLFIEFTKPILNQTVSFVKSYYSKIK